MKRNIYLAAIGVGLCGSFSLSAQQVENEFFENFEPIKKYTLMERFEPELIHTASKRKRLKAQQFKTIKLKLEILDTMDIPEQKREKLRSEVIAKFSSPILSPNLAETQFFDENE